MSQEDLTQFLEAVQQDSSLQEKLRAQGADPVAIAREAGFSITKAELLRDQAGRLLELSDEDLEKVAGGEACPSIAHNGYPCPGQHTDKGGAFGFGSCTDGIG